MNAKDNKKLFVDKSIEINTVSSNVWSALTKLESTGKWATEFTGGTPFYIQSDWQLGSPVLWKNDKGHVLVEGIVTKIELNKFLRFTVLDTSGVKHTMSEEDGITYKMTEAHGKTVLRVLQGDFSKVPEGEKYYTMTEKIWSNALPKIKKTAEET